MKKEWNIRLVYLYLVSFVSLMMLVIGTVQLIQAAVEFAYPPPVYYPGPLEVKERAANQNLPADVLEEQARLERERQERQAEYQRARQLAGALSLLVVALPLYRYHWRRIQAENGGGGTGQG